MSPSFPSPRALRASSIRTEADVVELSLTRAIPGEVLEHVEASGRQRYIGLTREDAGPSRRDALTTAIERLHASLEGVEEGSATRVTVHDLGSLDWGLVTSHVRVFPLNAKPRPRPDEQCVL